MDDDPLPAVTDPEKALEGGPLVHEQFGTNKVHEWSLGGGDLEAGFAEADLIVERRVVNHRISGAPIEPRGVLADYRAVRNATLAFLSGLTAEAWLRRGVVTDYTASVRGLAFHIAGHELRHLRALREKYLRPPTAHGPVG